VLLDIPIDVLFAPVEQAAPVGAGLGLPPAPASDGVDAALALLRAAERPVIVAGGGVRGEVPCVPLVEFAELTGIPVFHPGMIVGAMPPDHPLNGFAARNLGALASDGEPPDVVVLLGTRAGFYLGGRGGAVLPMDAKIIQVDIDGTELSRLRPADVAITADARETLRALTAAGSHEAWPDRSEWAARAAGSQRAAPAFADEPVEVGGRVHPYHGLREVMRSLEPESNLVIDGGEIAAWATMSIHEARPRRAVGCGYLGYLGITPGLAIGTQLAEPDRRVVLLIGDGGMGFHLQELDTMVRHGLPILAVVVNNESWAMSLHGQQLLFGDDSEIISKLADTDYDRVAAGFGAHGERVDRFDEVAPAVKRALAADGPAVVNLAVSPDVVHPVTEGMIGSVGAGEATVIPYYDNIER
jgi:acetolactate synthase-1/2/3 large subunit